MAASGYVLCAGTQPEPSLLIMLSEFSLSLGSQGLLSQPQQDKASTLFTALTGQRTKEPPTQQLGVLATSWRGDGDTHRTCYFPQGSGRAEGREWGGGGCWDEGGDQP